MSQSIDKVAEKFINSFAQEYGMSTRPTQVIDHYIKQLEALIKSIEVEAWKEIENLPHREIRNLKQYSDIWGESCPTNELPYLIVFRGNDFLAHTTLDHLKQTKGDI